MNSIFSKHVSFLASLAAFAVAGSGLSAQASATPLVDTASVSDTQRSLQEAAIASVPVPGTTATEVAPLTQTDITPQLGEPAAETNAPEPVAQIDIDPGIPTVGGSSYVGIAGNIGLDGDTALGDGSFMVISKIGLTNNISARPSAVLGDNTIFLIPVTFDVSILPVDAFEQALPLAPYVGGGVAIGTGDNDDIGPLVTAGVDFGISPQFTATAAVNVGFLDDTDIGLLIGIGYNFGRLGL